MSHGTTEVSTKPITAGLSLVIWGEQNCFRPTQLRIGCMSSAMDCLQCRASRLLKSPKTFTRSEFHGFAT